MRKIIFIFIYGSFLFSFSFKELILDLLSKDKILNEIQKKFNSRKYPYLLYENDYEKFIISNQKVVKDSLLFEIKEFDKIKNKLYYNYIYSKNKNFLKSYFLNTNIELTLNNIKKQICRNNLIKKILDKNINIIFNYQFYLINKKTKEKLFIGNKKFFIKKTFCKI